MFKNYIHSQLLKRIFFVPNHCGTQITKITKLQNTLFYHSVKSLFAVQLFLGSVYFTADFLAQQIELLCPSLMQLV